MINLLFTEIPIEQIVHLTRKEFIGKEEKLFHKLLKRSIAKIGIKDPVYIWYQSRQWGNIFKVNAGNNRIVVAKELGIKTIPCLVTQFDAENSKLEGKVINDDNEIKQLFHLPDQVTIRRHKDGWINQILCTAGGGGQRFVKFNSILYN